MRCVIWALAAAACGDNLGHEEPYEATSGARIKLRWYLYQDGSRQRETRQLYDGRLHTLCTTQRWIDDTLRCVPVAEEAVYADATCTMALGRSTEEEPTHFVGYDRVDGNAVAARAYRAGARVAGTSEHYVREDGECRGPFANPDGVTYHEVEELPGDILVTLEPAEHGAGRLALRQYRAYDGLRLPLAMYDRELGLDCRAVIRTGETATCEPVTSTPATHFADADCRQPVVLATTAEPPAVARTRDATGCARYHAVGDEVQGTIYRRDRDACLPLTAPVRALLVGDTLALATLDTTIEDTRGRRLQRIVTRTDGLFAMHDQLFDSATRAECRSYEVDGIARCIPASFATVRTLYAAGCSVPVLVAEVPACDPPAFAAVDGAEGLEVRAVGATPTALLYHYDIAGTCQPFTAAPDIVIRAVGPVLPPEAFVGGVPYGDR